MARRLTDEEREARRRARSRFSFSDAAYQHFDPHQEGYGSADDWMRAAELLTGGLGVRKAAPRINPDLTVLNLTEMPDHISGLKKAFRNTLFVVHPDHGGTNELCREAMAAFERLSKFY